MTAPQSERKFHNKYKGVVQKHGNKLSLHLPFVFLFPLLLVLIHSIYWPGPIYCSDTDCPSSDPSIPDAALLAVVLVLYFYVFMVGISILCASGSWMNNAVRNKLVVAILFLLGSVSIVQLVSPIVLRTLVYPYYRVNSYNIEISRVSDSSATMQLSNYYSPLIGDRSIDKVFVQVKEANGDERDIDDLSAYQDTIYRDSNYESSSRVEEGMFINRTISKLEDDKWYLFMVIPCTKESSGSNIFEGNYYSDSISTTLTDNSQVKDVVVDLRAFKLCKWSKDLGCQDSYH